MLKSKAKGNTQNLSGPDVPTFLKSYMHTHKPPAQQTSQQHVASGYRATGKLRASKPLTLRLPRIHSGSWQRGTSFVCAASHGSAYPFVEGDYNKVRLIKQEPYKPMFIYTDNKGRHHGVLAFQQEQHAESVNDNTMIMEVFVAGDTAVSIYSELQGENMTRPSTQDLMWMMMQQAGHSHPKEWQLLKVAIVELCNDVYIGRLFFGDPTTQEVAWDCDCRPSDGCFLSLRSGCPFYIHKNVWDATALPLSRSATYKQAKTAQYAVNTLADVLEQSAITSPTSPAWGSPVLHTGLAPEELNKLRDGDPEHIKLLKRELALAVAEEDYKTAARIRDHPWMQLYKKMFVLRKEGMHREAFELEQALKRMIEENSHPK